MSFSSVGFCARGAGRDRGIWACTKSGAELSKLAGVVLGPDGERWGRECF